MRCGRKRWGLKGSRGTEREWEGVIKDVMEGILGNYREYFGDVCWQLL